MDTRARIAAALGEVEGLTAYEVAPDVIDPGAAWPVRLSWRPLNMTDGFPTEEAWGVIVALPPGNLSAAMEAGDAWLMPVAMALFGAGIWVERAEPVMVQTGPQSPETLPALRFTLAL